MVRRRRAGRFAGEAGMVTAETAVVLPVLLLVAGPVAAVPGVLWLAAVSASAVWIARSVRRPQDVALAATLLVVLHVCYGSGVVRGALAGRRAVDAPQPVAWSGSASDAGTVAGLP